MRRLYCQPFIVKLSKLIAPRGLWDCPRAHPCVVNHKYDMRLYEIINEALIDDPVERKIRQLGREMQMSPWAINNGWCWGFANRLAKALGPEAEVVSTTEMEGVFPGHSVVRYRGKYYDAETPRGVVDPRDLDYSKRLYSLKD